MKRFVFAVAFCTFLTGVLSFFLFPVTRAAENPLLTLLNLPAPPPPNPQVTLSSSVLSENSFTKSNPPPDNAPIEVLMEYWQRQAQTYNELRYKVFPSEKALDRILAEIEKDPAKIMGFLNILPQNDRSAEFVKGIYDGSSSGTELEREQRAALKRWMKYHTPHFSAELARAAAHITDGGDYVLHHRELIALARVDWDRANPIVSRLYGNVGQPASRAAAIWALYLHAMQAGSPGDTDRYRDELKAIVSDKSLQEGVRDLALDALSLEKEWSGRDEWYLSLMEDDTLTDLGRFTGLTTLPSNSPDEKYVDRMIALLDSDNITVRTAAALNLLDRLGENRTEVVKALVHWLEDPKWLRETRRAGREALIRALTQVKIPESVPGLIAALDEKGERISSAYAANMVANAANAVSNASLYSDRALPPPPPLFRANSNAAANSYRPPTETYYPLRNNAIEALAFQKDTRAAPALRRLLNESAQPYEQNQIVRALYECGGFTLAEQAAAVEVVAKSLDEEVSEPGESPSYSAANIVANYKGTALPRIMPRISEYSIYDKNGVPTTDVARMLGIFLVTRVDVGDDLARAVIDRIAAIDRSDPPLANAMRKIIMRWQGSAINAMLLNDLKNNKIDPDAIVRLLFLRKELREKQAQDVFDLRTGGATAVGISSCLLEDPTDHEAILNDANDETKTALLACARLIRAPLNVHKVAENLQSKDKLLALAAERYLETEDSPEARRIVLSLHPNEAKILGATTAFYVDSDGGGLPIQYLFPLFATVSPYHATPQGYYAMMDRDEVAAETEKRLQAEVKKDTDLLGVYNWQENFIRVYKDRALVSWEQDPARYRERVLTKDEFDNFKGLLAHYKADELPPFLSCVGETCQTRQLLMLGRSGGRRVFVKAASMPPLFAELDRMFEDMRRRPSAIKYWAGKDVPGLVVLFADDRLDAIAVWKNGADFRLLTADKVRRAEIDKEIDAFGENLPEDEEETGPEYGEDERVTKERSKREYENFGWNEFAGGTLGSAATQPTEAEFTPLKDNFAVPPSGERWKARAGTTEIRADEKGLYKIAAGKLTRIKSGHYDEPVVTPNGRWVVATRYDDNEGGQLVRVNLLTNKQFVVKSEELPAYRAIAFVSSINRVLVGPPDDEYDHSPEEEDGPAENQGSVYSLLDPETGALIPARGDVRPLVHQKYRPLQPAANPFEFWAAIPKENETVIGIYNTRNFIIKPLLKLPKISFDSMDMWVDDVGGKAYFVYEGHLLAAPIKVGR